MPSILILVDSQRARRRCHIHYQHNNHPRSQRLSYKSWQSRHNLPGTISSIAIAALATRTACGLDADEARAKRMGPGYFPAWIACSTCNAPGNIPSIWLPPFTATTPMPCLGHYTYVNQPETIYFRAWEPGRWDRRWCRPVVFLGLCSRQVTRCNLYVTIQMSYQAQ